MTSPYSTPRTRGTPSFRTGVYRDLGSPKKLSFGSQKKKSAKKKRKSKSPPRPKRGKDLMKELKKLMK